jgi:hypothetical protein
LEGDPNQAASQADGAKDKYAAKLLIFPTRDDSITGPVVREAHVLVGRYLAMEFVPTVWA